MENLILKGVTIAWGHLQLADDPRSPCALLHRTTQDVLVGGVSNRTTLTIVSSLGTYLLFLY